MKNPCSLLYLVLFLLVSQVAFAEENYILREMKRDSTLWADKDFQDYMLLAAQEQYMPALNKYPSIKKRFKKHQVLLASAAMYYEIVGLMKEAKAELMESYKFDKSHQLTLMLLTDIALKEQNFKEHAKYVHAGLQTYGDLNIYFIMQCMKLQPRDTQLRIARNILSEAQKTRTEDFEIEIFIDVFDTMLSNPLRPGFEVRYQKIMASGDNRVKEMAEKVRESYGIQIPKH